METLERVIHQEMVLTVILKKRAFLLSKNILGSLWNILKATPYPRILGDNTD